VADMQESKDATRRCAPAAGLPWTCARTASQYHCEITTKSLTLPSSISWSSGHLITEQEAKL